MTRSASGCGCAFRTMRRFERGSATAASTFATPAARSICRRKAERSPHDAPRRTFAHGPTTEGSRSRNHRRTSTRAPTSGVSVRPATAPAPFESRFDLRAAAVTRSFERRFAAPRSERAGLASECDGVRPSVGGRSGGDASVPRPSGGVTSSAPLRPRSRAPCRSAGRGRCTRPIPFPPNTRRSSPIRRRRTRQASRTASG